MEKIKMLLLLFIFKLLTYNEKEFSFIEKNDTITTISNKEYFKIRKYMIIKNLSINGTLKKSFIKAKLHKLKKINK